MQELLPSECFEVVGGNVIALPALGGMTIGGLAGTLAAYKLCTLSTYSIIPIWLAAGTSAGATIGLLAGIAFAAGGSIHCYTCSHES